MKAKIFVAYHKEAKLLKNSIFEPIHVGREISSTNWLENNMIGDNIGNNISHKNLRYCELTAQYLIWKNPDLVKDIDYIGFCHYRRFFNFNTEFDYSENILSQVDYPFIDNNCYQLFGLDEENIINTISNQDLITFKPADLTKNKRKNVYQQYKTAHNIKDYEVTLKILLNKYPEFQNAVNTYNNSKYGYFANSFIMKKELFNRYAEWLFSILIEVEEQIEYSEADRLMGFLSERLFGIYITYLKQQNFKIKELQQVFVQSTDIKNNIPIVFACNNNYALHLCCAITSILENAQNNEFFFFYIINTKKNLNYINKRLLSRLQRKNCIIKFLTIDDEKFKNVPITPDCSHITKETYYRFLLPELLPFFEKILYLDCDITVKSSLSDLYNIDIKDYYIGGVIDVLNADSEKRLNIKKYCNAGVLVVNLNKWRQDKIQDKLFKYTHENIDKIVWVDQDVLNIVLQDGIKYIDKFWNAQVGEYEHCYSQGFNKIGQTAKIIHHIGSIKPWTQGCNSPFKNIYFKYLNKMDWEYKFLKYNIIKFQEICIFIYKRIKSFRKKFFWYDKTNQNIVIFSYYKIKV